MFRNIHRWFWLAALVAGAMLVLGALPAAAQNYPRRPVTEIVPWGAGGGTDAVGRILGSLLEQELDQPFNVVNRTGGSGVVGHSAIAFSQPNGYTIGVVTVELTMMHWVGLTELTYKDVTPIGLVNRDPAGIMVASDAQWNTAQELLDYIKANPGELQASGTGQGGIWHLALAGMLQEAGMDPNAVKWVPSKGAAPGLQDLIAGGVDIVTASIPEGQSLIESGRVKALAVMGEERNNVFPEVPTLKEATGLDWTTYAWRGIAGPKNLDSNVVKVLEPAVKKVVNSQEYKDFLAKRGFGWAYMTADEFGTFMAEADASNGKVMKAAGIAK